MASSIGWLCRHIERWGFKGVDEARAHLKEAPRAVMRVSVQVRFMLSNYAPKDPKTGARFPYGFRTDKEKGLDRTLTL